MTENSRKPRIGMIVAVEIGAVAKRYESKLVDVPSVGFDVKLYSCASYDMYIVNSGAGEIASSSAAQFLISAFKVDMIVNFGVVGGLTEEMTVSKLAVITSVVHYDFDVSEYISTRKAQYANYPSCYIPTNERLVELAVAIEPTLKKVICASGDKFIGAPERKQALNREYGADICEMEAAGIVLTCNRSGVPCLLIKAVSDSMKGGAEEFQKEFERCADICLDTVERIIENEKFDIIRR